MNASVPYPRKWPNGSRVAKEEQPKQKNSRMFTLGSSKCNYWYGSNHFQKGENFELPTCFLVGYACINIQRKRCLEIFIVVMSGRVFEILKQIIFMHLTNSTN